MSLRSSCPSKRSDDFSPSRPYIKDSTVQVEVKKPKRLTLRDANERDPTAERRRSDGEDAKLSQSARSGHQRSRTAYARPVPWVPAPAKTQRPSRITWEADKAMLEIPFLDAKGAADAAASALADADIPLERSDLSDQDAAEGYQRADPSPSPPPLKSSLKRSPARESISGPVGDDSSTELHVASTDYAQAANKELAKEVKDLQATLSSLRAEAEASRREVRTLNSERDQLMRRVTQLEAGTLTPSRAVIGGAESLSRLPAASSGAGDGSGLQHDALLLKLSEFEETNRLLRRLLDEQQQQQRSGRVLEAAAADDELRSTHALVTRLTAANEENGRLRAQLIEQEKRTLDQRIQLESVQDDQLKLRSIQTSLEQTRAHLQRELRSREADCNRMAVQVRTLESRLAQEKIEVDHLQELLRQAHAKYDQDKDALKKAARLQKQRATETTGAAEQLHAKLTEKEQLLADAVLARDALRNRSERLAADVATLTNENNELKKRLSGQDAQHSTAYIAQQEKVESLMAELLEKNKEAALRQAECDRQAALAAALEKRAVSAEELVAALRADVARIEANCAETERSLSKTKRDAVEASEQLAEQRQLVERVRAEADSELDDMRQRLMARLSDLEPLPETLRNAELRRSAAEERVLVLERQSAEAAKGIALMAEKAETQSQELASWKDKYHKLEMALQDRIDQLQRRLKEAEARNAELSSVAARRDETISLAGQRAEQLIRDNAALAGQLEAALADARRAHEEARERATLKEKGLSERVNELDQQLVAAKSEVAKARRERDDTERRLASKLADLKDRLEQSHSTNRSMQNYVQVLKNSYASIFGDMSVAAIAVPDAPIASSSPVPHRSHTSAFQ